MSDDPQPPRPESSDSPSDSSGPNPPPSATPGGTGVPAAPGQGGGYSQDVTYAQASARLPEKVARGVFATAALVLRGGHEVAFDFLLRMVPPPMMSARVVVPYAILGSIAMALEENWNRYRDRFGTPPAPPPPPPNFQPPKIADVYAEMKISDESAIPAYANTLMVTHSAFEFCFDFITDLFPRPVVTCRVYLSAMQIPGLLETIKRTVAQVQAQHLQQAQLPWPTISFQPPSPPGGGSSEKS